MSEVADQDGLEVDKVDNWLLAKVERCSLKPDLGWGHLEGEPLCCLGLGRQPSPAREAWGLGGSWSIFLCGCPPTDAATHQNNLLSLLFASLFLDSERLKVGLLH